MRIFNLLFVSICTFLISCGNPESDAKDVCDCYKEVKSTKDDAEADQKMSECLELLEKYQQNHKDNGTLEEFNKAYDFCR